MSSNKRKHDKISNASACKKAKHTQSNDLTADDVDYAVARFFFGCNIAFNVAESQHFKTLVNRLHNLKPSTYYKPPHRQKLSATLLEKVHQDVVAERVSLQGSSGVILVDGWKNSSKNTQNVVCTLHTVNSKSIFLQSWDMTGQNETGKALTNIINEARELAKKKYNIFTYAVVSDNASPMVWMGKNVDVWHSTCHSHSGNLLAKDFISSNYKKNIKLLRSFKTPGAEKELKDRGGCKIILPGETRWCSYRDSFRCILKNLEFMKALVQEGKVKLEEESRKLFNDPLFSQTIMDYILIMDPVCELINTCQRSDCNVAEGCEQWLRLQVPAVDLDKENLLEARLKKVLKPLALAANLLHPKFRGQYFKETHKTSAISFLQENLNLKNGENIPGLDEYENNLGYFKKLSSRKITTPNTFWTLAQPFYPELSLIALKLSKIPAASAQLERLFSSWAFVHSDLRNRLTVDKSMKLVDIYYSLKMAECFDEYYDLIDFD